MWPTTDAVTVARTIRAAATTTTPWPTIWLAVLTELDLNDVCLVGHSMAGGELIRYLSRHGTSRVERIVLLSSVLPVTIAGADNPGGLDPSLFEALRSAWRTDFGQWLEDSADAYFACELSGNLCFARDRQLDDSGHAT